MFVAGQLRICTYSTCFNFISYELTTDATEHECSYARKKTALEGWYCTREAFVLTNGFHLLAAPSQDFVAVCLVADIPDDFVMRSVENKMQSHRELCYSQ